MFWLRFFGSRVRDSAPCATFALDTTAAHNSKFKTLDSCLLEGETVYTGEDFEKIRSRGSRRSAIDLSTTTSSLDIGPHAVYRLSFDTFANPSYHLTSLLKGYTNIQTLHKGSHARILKAEKKGTQEGFVFKLYDKSTLTASQHDDVSKELDILRKGADYGTVELVDVFEDESLILLTFKECQNGTLMACIDDHGGLLTEEQCVQYVAVPVLNILSKLHGAGLVHRDIKPEHILFDDLYNAHLCDFYLAGVMGRDAFTDREGTLSYMAPEVVAKPTPEEIFHIVLSHGVDEMDLPSYNEKVDVWSLGVVLVEALTGMLPFVSESAEGMLKVHNAHFSGEAMSAAIQQLETSGQISSDGVDFLSRIFQKDPNDRASASSLLAHPWLHSISD